MKKLLTLITLIFLFLITSCSPTATPPAPEQPKEEAQQEEAPTEEVEAAAATNTPQPEAPTPTAGPPTATPTPAEPFPPVIVQTSPQVGEEVPLDGAIEITFDQPMDRDSVEKAFAIEPGASADGTFEWLDDQTVRFTLADEFQRGERYRVRIVDSAQSQAGLNLTNEFQLTFSTVGFLEVSNVQPAPGTSEVLPESQVVVFFNRPVVPLTAIEAQGSLPDPLTFTPPVSGEGEWLNTATYQFTPEGEGFLPATEYTARVAQGLTDVSGQAVLEDDFEWRFSTISPAVVASVPAPDDIYVSPTPAIRVAFNQAMDRESVEQNLLLVEEATGEPVPGQFEWEAEGLVPPPPIEGFAPYPPEGSPEPEAEPLGVETVVFTPANPLTLGTSYQLMLPRGVTSQAGTETRSDYSATFTVTPPLEVLSTNPPSGEQFADIWQGLDITFSAPISLGSIRIGENLLVEPDIAASNVFSYTSNNDTMLTIGFSRQENKVYTVTLEADIEGRYGQPLGDDVSITWKTLRRSPYVRIVSPKIGVYNGYQDETYVYMTVRNVNEVNFELYRLDQDEFLQLAQTSFRGWDSYDWDRFNPEPAELVGQWSQTTDPEAFENYVYRVDVSAAVANGQALPPGLYYLEAFATEEDFYPEAQVGEFNEAIDRQVLIVTRNSITVKRGSGDVLAWLTDLQSGQPIPDVPLTFVDPANQRQSGQTDAEGTATFTYTLSPDNPNQAVIVISGSPEQPDNFGIGSAGWSAGISPYEFSNLFGNVNYGYNTRWVGHIYSERPLYRPGQTVYFKGILRHSDDAQYSLPDVENVQVNIYDAQYRQIYSEELPLNDFGTINGAFPLDEEASLGYYNLEMSYPGPEGPQWITSNSFTVAEYRRPEFLVEAETDKDEYLQGEEIKLNVETEFFFGGPVQNAQVRWTLLSDPYYFNYEGPGFYSFTNEDDIRSNNFNPNYSFGFGEQIASGTGTTDAEGRFTVAVPADLTGRLASQTFTFDVAVIGLNNQEVAARAQAVVHKGLFYVGLRPVEYVGQIGVDNEVEVLVVDWESQPVANQEVELIVAEQNWYSVQQLDPEGSRTGPDDQFYWENLVEDEAIFTTTVTTNAQGQAIASFTPESGGSYKVYARASDELGHEIFSSTFVWVSGFEYVNWGQENNDRLELVADKTLYSTGDTANILVPHPYSGTVTALVTVERAHIYEHFVTELETNSAQISIPVTEAMIPNAFVSVMIVAGGEVPSFKLGYTKLNVNTAEKTLDITLTPSSPPEETGYYLPGANMEYQVKVTDYQGQPVEAELSLALIDKAILTLMPDQPGQLLETFWKQRTLEVETGTSLTLALDRINQALDERKGGGGGDGGVGPESVRQNFADTALWIADFVTDENGEGVVEVTLPDNLTTWVLIGKGVTGAETLVGEARVEIVTSKPLLVRPVTPRFLVVGDEVQMGLIVHNNGNQALEVNPGFEAEGLEIGEWRVGEGDWLEAGQTQPLEVAPGEEVKLEYRVAVLEAETAEFTMGASAGEFEDAVAMTLPIYHLSTPETVATAGVVVEDGVRLESIALPQAYDPSRGELNVKVEPSLAAGMQAGLAYLEHFPYECVEQTVSRFLPNIFTYRAYQDLGLSQPNLAESLSRQIGIGVQRLNTQQNIDGGWGWWPGEASNPFVTGYVVLGLVEARRADFAVEDWVIENAVNYLKQTLVAPNDIAAAWQANQQAFTLYVLAEAGQSDLSRSVALFEQREQLDMYGRAFLALAIALADPQANQIETLINDLTTGAVASATGAHWEEGEVDYRAMNTDVRSTAIVIATLSRLQPDHPLLPPAIRWLMTVREQEGYWSTTQETAWALIGLTDWLVVSGELEGDYTWRVGLNGETIGEGEVNETNLDQVTEFRVAISELLADSINRLTLEKDGATTDERETGRMYYGAYLTYFKPVEQVKALDRGIIVSRQYSLQDDPDQAITEAEVGEFIQVKLTLIAPMDLHYVIVEDYLPAGTEALNSSLATTSVVGQPPQLSRADTDGEDPWGWYFTHTDLRDEKAVLFANYLPKGVYEYTYTIRAAIPGEYHVIPTHAAQMYFPEVFGRSDGGLFRVME